MCLLGRFSGDVMSYIFEHPCQYLALELNKLLLGVRPTGSILQKLFPALHLKKKKKNPPMVHLVTIFFFFFFEVMVGLNGGNKNTKLFKHIVKSHTIEKMDF